MKKILLILVLAYILVLKVNAYTLESIDLPYYIKLNDEIMTVKKVYISETGEALFNTSLNYNVVYDYSRYKEDETINYKTLYSKITLFRNMTYYGYSEDKSDLNYLVVQVAMWKYLFNNKTIVIVDEQGNEIDKYNDMVSKIYSTANTHALLNDIFCYDYETVLGETKILEYSPSAIVYLDIDDVEGLDIETTDNKIYITSYKVGEYSLTFYKNYEQAFYSYTDGTYSYWQNLGGPQNLSFTINYKVEGSKITINETYEGVNGLYGDATLNSSYELYSNNEYLGSIDNLSYLYVKYNNDYVLKDTSIEEGFMRNEDILFSTSNEDYVVNITKYVIAKNISINVVDDNTYYIYLKSSNELYEVVDKNTSVITLPYGTYYIEGDNYYYEFSVLDDTDEVFEIGTIMEDDNYVMENEDNTSEEEIINPQTGDNIFLYIKLILFIIASISLCFIMTVF